MWTIVETRRYTSTENSSTKKHQNSWKYFLILFIDWNINVSLRSIEILIAIQSLWLRQSILPFVQNISTLLEQLSLIALIREESRKMERESEKMMEKRLFDFHNAIDNRIALIVILLIHNSSISCLSFQHFSCAIAFWIAFDEMRTEKTMSEKQNYINASSNGKTNVDMIFAKCKTEPKLCSNWRVEWNAIEWT